MKNKTIGIRVTEEESEMVHVLRQNHFFILSEYVRKEIHKMFHKFCKVSDLGGREQYRKENK